MQSKISKATKETHPRFDAFVGADVPTVMIVFEVDFLRDDGQLHHSQSYAVLPEEFDDQMFDRQAKAMQDEIDHAALNQQHNERALLADDIVARLSAGGPK